MKKLIIVLMLFSFNAVAKNAETWNCGELFSASKTRVKAIVYEDRKTGIIRTAGINHKAVFRLEGLDRVWDFGDSGKGSFNYAFVIAPDGYAKYYDFSANKKRARHKARMECKLLKWQMNK